MSGSFKIKVLKDLDTISKEFERLTKQFSVFNSPLAMITQNTWRPPTDVYETRDKIIIKMEIAGVHLDLLEIKVIGSTLIITGKRSDQSEDEKINYRLMEINYGFFEKMIPVKGEIDFDNIYGVYKDGFIEIGLPKLSNDEDKIDINISQGE